MKTTTVKYDDGSEIEIPTSIIAKASEVAYDEDADQVVGMIQEEWTIRGYEDPESDTMAHRVIVDSSGIK